MESSSYIQLFKEHTHNEEEKKKLCFFVNKNKKKREYYVSLNNRTKTW